MKGYREGERKERGEEGKRKGWKEERGKRKGEKVKGKEERREQ